jgi:hypothetical protein
VAVPDAARAMEADPTATARADPDADRDKDPVPVAATDAGVAAARYVAHVARHAIEDDNVPDIDCVPTPVTVLYAMSDDRVDVPSWRAISVYAESMDETTDADA